ncbi:FAD-dependent oxidoreductase [Candidatus Aerophobetes bacterium]|nr:FAD-dependent oxidoreductase [Candidatus Aerophobetes bacterium]
MVLQKADLVVIGAGPAGVAAAIKAKEMGVNNVIIMERAEQLGGLLHQCIHNGFGLQYFKEDLTGPEYAYNFIEKAKGLGIKFLLETMALDISPKREITAVSNKEGIINLHPKAIILAMGCRERTRGAINIPGTRPAGIFTAGVAQRFVNVEGFIPGKKVVILGSGDVGMIMARRLTLEGVKVEAMVEILPYVGGLIRNEVQCIHDFNIPLFLEHTVVDVHGTERVKAVTIAKIDKDRNPIYKTKRKIECDTLLLSVGLIPENELSLKAGIKLDPVTGGPIVDETMQTNVSGIFAAGNVVHVHDLVDYVSFEGELAGSNAANYILSQALFPKMKINLKAGEGIRYIVPSTISGQKKATLYMRVLKPDRDVVVKVGDDFLRKHLPIVKPSEMLKIIIPLSKLKMLKDETKELTISCTKGRK